MAAALEQPDCTCLEASLMCSVHFFEWLPLSAVSSGVDKLDLGAGMVGCRHVALSYPSCSVDALQAGYVAPSSTCIEQGVVVAPIEADTQPEAVLQAGKKSEKASVEQNTELISCTLPGDALAGWPNSCCVCTAGPSAFMT